MFKTMTRVFFAAALLAATAARAQDYTSYRPIRTLYVLNWEPSWTVGSFSDDYIDEWSWRGISFEGRTMVREGISVGLGFNFNRFEQTQSDVVRQLPSGGTISGPVFRYADDLGIKALIHGYLARGPLLPYVGVGIGGVWTYAYSQAADLGDSDDSFSFIVSPEVGLIYTVARGATTIGLNLAVRYNYTTADFGQVSDAQWINGAVGLVFAY
jgi:hypothetical protein